MAALVDFRHDALVVVGIQAGAFGGSFPSFHSLLFSFIAKPSRSYRLSSFSIPVLSVFQKNGG